MLFNTMHARNTCVCFPMPSPPVALLLWCTSYRCTSAPQSVSCPSAIHMGVLWGKEQRRRACTLEASTLLILFTLDKRFQWPVLLSSAACTSLACIETGGRDEKDAGALLSQSLHIMKCSCILLLTVHLTMWSCWGRLGIWLQPHYLLFPSSLSAGIKRDLSPLTAMLWSTCFLV